MGRKNKLDYELHIEEAVFDVSREYEGAYREIPASRTAFLLVLGIAATIVTVVIFRIGFLSFIKGEFYEARASANMGYEINIPAHRAVIVDQFGEVLVQNASSFSVYVHIPTLFQGNEINTSLLNAVGRALEIPVSELEASIATIDFESESWALIAHGITAQEAIMLRQLDKSAIRIVDDFTREYIDGPIFAHIIGYTGDERGNRVKGVSGIEAYYDNEIKGDEGRRKFYEDALGELIDEQLVREPKASPPLELTIDKEFQTYFYNRLVEGLASLNRDSGIGIALDPRNGAVRALISLPSFDNNVFVNRALSQERALILQNTREPLFNRAVSGIYSPGSTIKPLVAIAALREGVVTPETQIFSAGTLSIPNPYVPESPSVFLDWKAHGWVDVVSALARSSNIYFYAAGGGLPQSVRDQDLTNGAFSIGGLGIDRLKQYWKTLGFGGKTGIDIPGEENSFLPDPELKEKLHNDIWRLGDTYNVSIGQGDLSITPLQLASFIASIGNRGMLFRPYLKKDSPPRALFDYRHWSESLEVVREGLEDAVLKSYGTAHSLSDLPFSIAGKTGSAQTNNNAKVNALFIGYAPSENPEIALLILVENAREGSLNTLPIAHDVLRWYYEHRMANDAVISNQ